jgi:hypothetical protein
LIVAPGDSTIVTSSTSRPLMLTGCEAYCGGSVSSPRARRT